MKVNIQLEGQRGLNWERWTRLVPAVEDLGFDGIFRSDHFYDAEPPEMDSLELWTSLTWVASNTKRIQFGPLVTPVSFHHPAHIARRAKDLDNLSGGRLTDGGQEFLIRTLNQFETVDDIANAIIFQRGGRILRLKDVTEETQRP